MAKTTGHENTCLLSRQSVDYHCHCQKETPDKISGNRQDSDTVTTGATHCTVAAAFEGLANKAVVKPSPRPATPTRTHYLVAFMEETQARVAHL